MALKWLRYVGVSAIISQAAAIRKYVNDCVITFMCATVQLCAILVYNIKGQLAALDAKYKG